ncbi:MAG: hypothetical protein ACC608_02475 [Anaerofustis sp.]
MRSYIPPQTGGAGIKRDASEQGHDPHGFGIKIPSRFESLPTFTVSRTIICRWNFCQNREDDMPRGASAKSVLCPFEGLA